MQTFSLGQITHHTRYTKSETKLVERAESEPTLPCTRLQRKLLRYHCYDTLQVELSRLESENSGYHCTLSPVTFPCNMASYIVASESSCEACTDDSLRTQTATDDALRRTRLWSPVSIHERRPVADVESVVSASLLTVKHMPWPKSVN